MSELGKKGNSIFGIEDVTIGDHTSLPSKIVFFLLCFLPLFATVLFGGVDNITWIFISIAWALIVLLWVAETWTTGGLLI